NSKKDSILKTDSLFFSDFTTKILLSIKVDTLDTKRFDKILRRELDHKELDVSYAVEFKNGVDIPQAIHPEIKRSSTNITCSNNSLLPDGSSLCLYFTNNTIIVLKRNLVGILLSTLLVGSVIACLLFLLKIINRQKQLAEIKNDLIGNITHEFKTPIATIGVALEGIQNFNTANDPQKTKKYVQTSNEQLGKLNLMVEKLLETATLDGDLLSLKKEEIKLIEIVQNLIERHRALAPEKDFEFLALRENICVKADALHLENALNNILDNAVKYGGDRITTTITTANNKVLISIKDDGKNLTTAQAKQIFEKFYRVPKGNQHDVKGFGIGLYYTKKIIEGHNGSIEVILKDSTNFKITLSHG
ncbi:MAG TPA: ATP-binding protein, partial [Pricia sp.]|nr:ATP-binding protein [Pricia sp.]